MRPKLCLIYIRPRAAVVQGPSCTNIRYEAPAFARVAFVRRRCTDIRPEARARQERPYESVCITYTLPGITPRIKSVIIYMIKPVIVPRTISVLSRGILQRILLGILFGILHGILQRISPGNSRRHDIRDFLGFLQKSRRDLLIQENGISQDSTVFPAGKHRVQVRYVRNTYIWAP